MAFLKCRDVYILRNMILNLTFSHSEHRLCINYKYLLRKETLALISFMITFKIKELNHWFFFTRVEEGPDQSHMLPLSDTPASPPAPSVGRILTINQRRDANQPLSLAAISLHFLYPYDIDSMAFCSNTFPPLLRGFSRNITLCAAEDLEILEAALRFALGGEQTCLTCSSTCDAILRWGSNWRHKRT